MSTESYEKALAATRGVLKGVSSDQLDDRTPCDRWAVRDLINHVVGAQHFFTACMLGEPGGGEVDVASGNFVASFDGAAERSLSAFGAEGAMERVVTLPFGDFPGERVAGIAATDTFAHGWDLAKATGQDTDLDPELAATLLALAKVTIPDAFRSEEGQVFKPPTTAPAGSSAADQFAAFLGRTV